MGNDHSRPSGPTGQTSETHQNPSSSGGETKVHIESYEKSFNKNEKVLQAREKLWEIEIRCFDYVFAWLSGRQKVLERSKLLSYLELPGNLGPKYLALVKEGEESQVLSYPNLLELVVKICREGKDKGEKEKIIFGLFSSEEGLLTREAAETMFSLLKELSFKTLETQENPEGKKTEEAEKSDRSESKETATKAETKTDDLLVKRLAQKLFAYAEYLGEKKEAVNLAEFKGWKDRNAPKLFQGFEAWIYNKFLGKLQDAAEEKKPQTTQAFSIAGPENVVTFQQQEERKRPFHTMPVVHELNVPSILTQDLAWFISCSIPETPVFVEEMTRNKVYEWHPLFLSSSHGFSLSLFENKCFDYPGATLLLAHDRSGLIFGSFNSKPWKSQRNVYFGDKTSLLFELSPHAEVCRAVGPQSNFTFYNSDMTTRGSNPGLGVGGEPKKPRLWLDSNLQTGKYNGGATCQTFEKLKGREIETQGLDILKLEVWGLGGERAAKYQKGQRDWENRQILRYKGAKRSDWDVDKTILEMLKFDFSS